MDTPLIHNNSKLWRYAHICHASADRRTHIKSIKHHLDQGTCTTCSWLRSHRTPFGHINTVAVNSQYKPWINKLMHHYMIKLTSGSFFIMNATEYWLFVHEFSIWNASVAALQFWTEELDPQTLSNAMTRRSIIQSLCDHIEQCLQTSTHIRRYWIQKWEQKYECSHSITLRTSTISHLHTRKFILQTCHPKNTPISQLPPMQCTANWLMKKVIHSHLHEKTAHLKTIYWLATYPA